jgi:2,4-dienoyl-CoA reductase-like NADH-dependent reductase (Old Yellow Enzyme family)
MGLWKDEQIPKLQQIVAFIEQQGAVAGIQLAHAGRKASCELPWKGGRQIQSGEHSWQPVAPSPIPFYETDRAPKALNAAEIKQVIAGFKAAAGRALTAGYKVIEIHAAHGYLINEFLSPLSNQRTDEYGGSLSNRARLLVEIIESVQQLWPADYPLFVRISASDWAAGGWTIEDSVQLSAILKDKGVDLVDASSGGIIPHVKIPLEMGYQVPFAARIKKETGILTGAVGMITSAVQAEEIIASGKANLVLMARELLRDPYFPLHAAHELGEDIAWPVQYARAKPATHS